MRRIVTYPNLVSTLALVIALSGGAYAAGLVGTADLKDGAVTTPKIHREAVTGTRLAPGVVDRINQAALPPTAVEVADSAIQQVGSSFTDVATLVLPTPGSYLVTGSLRIFPRAANPGHGLNCSYSGVSGGPFLSNVHAQDGEVRQVPLTGIITTMSPDQSVPLSCATLGGEITLTYDLVAVQVAPAG